MHNCHTRVYIFTLGYTQSTYPPTKQTLVIITTVLLASATCQKSCFLVYWCCTYSCHSKTHGNKIGQPSGGSNPFHRITIHIKPKTTVCHPGSIKKTSKAEAKNQESALLFSTVRKQPQQEDEECIYTCFAVAKIYDQISQSTNQSPTNHRIHQQPTPTSVE